MAYNFIVYVLSLLLLFISVADSSCTLPDQTTIEDILTDQYMSQQGEGGDQVEVVVLYYSYTCKAISSQDRYNSLSIVANFTANSKPDTIQYGQFQLLCIDGDWGTNPFDELLKIYSNGEDIFSFQTRTDCSDCSASATNSDENCIGKYNLIKLHIDSTQTEYIRHSGVIQYRLSLQHVPLLLHTTIII